MVSPAGRNAATATEEAERADPEEPAPEGGASVERRPRVDGGSTDLEAPAPVRLRTEAELALAARPLLVDEGVQVEDPDTDAALERLRDKFAAVSATRSMVSVTSTARDGSKTVRCTGIIVVVCSDEAGKHARILTASTAVCTSKGTLQDPKPKLSVRLPNGTVFEGQLLFFSDHYGLALLDIMVDFKWELASFGASPQYGQKVFVLARGENLMARRGTILFLEESFLGCNHNMFLSCKIPECGTGGPVIDQNGIVIGMTFFHSPNPAIIATSTIFRCIEMWTQYSRIARPVLGLHLRTLELLDISLREQHSIFHDINKGFIVDQVAIDSAAERLGIGQGDVIVFHELCGSTLPQLENFLLSCGWEYLQRNIDSCLMVDFKLEVHDLLGRTSRNITLTVGPSDASERVETNWSKLDSQRRVSTLSDPDTAAALRSLEDRDMALTTVRSVVGVSSSRPDSNNVFQCTGIVIAITSNDSGKRARILTPSSMFCTDEGNLHHPDQKVFVHLPNKTILEGHMSFLNTHYQIALLDISTDYPLRSVSFGQMPKYGQKVFLLGRDKDCSVIVRRGLISKLEQSSSRRNHYIFLSCKCGAPMDCLGGLVIDTNGNIIGISVAHCPKVAIISTTTVKTCIDMWQKFSCIARPMIDMDLRTVGLLAIKLRDKLSGQYDIESGFVVDMVRYGSAAGKNGIKKGDVIEIIDEECGSTLPQMEDYLLKLGWRFLHKGFDPRSTTDLMSSKITNPVIPRNNPMPVNNLKKNTRCRKVKDLFLRGTRQWNVEKLRELFEDYDVDEIIKLEPMRQDADTPAWHYESTGDDSRKIWNLIWKCKIPNKIRIFAWRCASDNLATKRNKWRRALEVDSTCNICGVEEESSFHATVNCTKAKALRFKMRECWSLPDEEQFKYTGPDWLLMLLANSSRESHPLILLLLWRAWHLRNNIVHADGLATIEASSVFLQNYVYTLTEAGYSLNTKKPAITSVTNNVNTGAESVQKKQCWSPPSMGKLKLNFDASFIQSTKYATMGAVIRDSAGQVIWSMAEKLTCCQGPEEAEAKALLRCLQHCVSRNITPAIVETDSSAVFSAVKGESSNLSRLCFIYREIQNIRNDGASFFLIVGEKKL